MKRDLINDCIKYVSPDNLANLNKKHGTMVTGDDFSMTNYGSDGMHKWHCFGLHPDRKGTTFQYKVDLA